MNEHDFVACVRQVVKRKRVGSGGSSITGGWVSAFTCFDAKGNFRGRYSMSSDAFPDPGGMFGGRFLADYRDEFSAVDSSDENRENANKDWNFPTIDADDICHNVVSCPVKIIDVTSGQYDGTLFVGQTVCEAERPGKTGHPTVRPRSDWCMAVALKE